MPPCLSFSSLLRLRIRLQQPPFANDRLRTTCVCSTCRIRSRRLSGTTLCRIASSRPQLDLNAAARASAVQSVQRRKPRVVDRVHPPVDAPLPSCALAAHLGSSGGALPLLQQRQLLLSWRRLRV